MHSLKAMVIGPRAVWNRRSSWAWRQQFHDLRLLSYLYEKRRVGRNQSGLSNACFAVNSRILGPRGQPSILLKFSPKARCLEVSTTPERWFFSSTAPCYDSGTSSLTTPFLLADIGEGIKEVELLQWYVAPGDALQQFDKVCEVQSDKATVEITSRFDGVVQSLAGDVGDMLQVGEPLLYLTTEGGTGEHADPAQHGSFRSTGRLHDDDENDEDHDTNRLHIPTVASHYRLSSDASGSPFKDSPQSATPPDSLSKNLKFLASPAVRKLGQQYQLDLSTIHPSGPHGNLLKHDVLTYLREQGRLPASETTTTAAATTKASSAAQATSAKKSTAPSVPHKSSDINDDGTIVTLKGYHRLMIQSMTSALQIPHMGFADELDVTELVTCRQHLLRALAQHENSSIGGGGGEEDASLVKISYLALLVKACSMALSHYPLMNASIHDLEAGRVLLHARHDLGIAMDTPRGLVVPVVRSCQERSVAGIQRELDRLKCAARQAKLAAADLQPGPTFTLSNIGAVGGGTYMSPIIVPPQVAVGALGKMTKRPRFVNDDGDGGPDGDAGDVVSIRVAHVLPISWAGDHRVLDGGTLARFHAKFKHYVEQPVRMLTELR